MDFKSKIVLIYGPTASGKSKFAIKLAKKINGEIINADSMQIYKELKILSARPLKKDYQKIKHHLYGFVSVKKNFSTGDWLKLVDRKISYIKKRKKIPILVGGTGLYFKSLIEGLANIPNIPNKFRKRIRNLHKELGPKDFFLELLKIDPLAKAKIKFSDSQRAIRAYEVMKFTRRSLYEWFKKTKSDYKLDEFYKIYIDYSRDELIKRINDRSREMMKKGALLEAKKFIKLKIPRARSANKAIGITELKEYIEKKIDIQEVIEKISIKTRQYAKRQVTWARGNMSDWKKVKPGNLDKFLKKI